MSTPVRLATSTHVARLPATRIYIQLTSSAASVVYKRQLILCTRKPVEDALMDGQADELDMKFQGYIKAPLSPDDSAVAIVKANVTDLPLARGTRSAAAIANDTPVTCPPSDPEAAPALIKSLLVLTVMPVGLPAVGGPSVTPLRVSTCDPAVMLPMTRNNATTTFIF